MMSFRCWPLLLAALLIESCAFGGIRPATSLDREQRYLWVHGAFLEVLGLGRTSLPYCVQQLYSQPNGPFAVALYCGDALGNQIAVLHYPHDHQLKHRPGALVDERAPGLV